MDLTIGLVGCGRWGGVHLRTLQNLKSTGHVRRVAVCDIDPDKLAGIQADATYASFDQMLEHEHLDGVAIVTPPNTHVDLARKALMHSLPALVEKPLAVEHEVANDFLNSLQENTVLVVGYILRHHYAIKHLQSPRIQDLLGEVRSVHYQRQTVRERPAGAQPISTLGVHALDLIAWLLGQPLMSGEVVNKSTTADTASVNLVFPSGHEGSFEVAWSASQERRLLHIEGTSGQVALDFGTGDIDITNKHGRTSFQSTGNEALVEEWKHFLAHLTAPKQHVFPSIERLIDQSAWLHAHGGEESV